MKNKTSTTSPTLETLNAALAVAVQMANDPKMLRCVRVRAAEFADTFRKEIERSNWRGDLDLQRLAHDAMGGM